MEASSRTRILAGLALLTMVPWGAASGDPGLPALPSENDGVAPCGHVFTRDLALPVGGLPGEGVEPPMAPSHLPNFFDACAGIRPGGRLSNVGCTMNFVFRDTNGTSTYIGTAGHCTNSVGQRMSVAGTGQFGTVVYRINSGSSAGNDFALIRIDADKVHLVSSTMCDFGGPNGTHTGTTPVGTELHEYGWGVMTQFHSSVRARNLVSVSQNANTVTWLGEGSGGDSGAPVTDSLGRAWGIHTFGVTPVFGVVGEGGTYIGKALSLSAAAGFNVVVVNG